MTTRGLQQVPNRLLSRRRVGSKTVSVGAGEKGVQRFSLLLEEGDNQRLKVIIRGASTVPLARGTWEREFSVRPRLRALTGRIVDESGGGLGGVQVALRKDGSAAGEATTEAAGNYRFADLRVGSYTVTPGKTGYRFSPENRSVAMGGNDEQVPSITGSRAMRFRAA